MIFVYIKQYTEVRMEAIENAQIVNETLNEKAYKRLKQAIVRHEIKPGTRILESHLATMFGISRTPVREAVNQLVSEGLIVSKGKGVNIVLDVTEKDVNEIYDLRLLIELHTIDYITSHVARFDDAPFRSVLDQYDEKRPDAVSLFMQQDEIFHETLVSMVGNDRMLKIYRDLIGQTKVFRRAQAIDQGKVRSAMDVHRTLLAALRDGDHARASNVMMQHLERGRKEALETFTQ